MVVAEDTPPGLQHLSVEPLRLVELPLLDDAILTLRYLVYGGDPETFFGQFSDNDFFEVRFEYWF